MRLSLVVVAVFTGSAFAPARAQCSSAIQKLVDDGQFSAAKADVQARLERNTKDDVALHCMGRIVIDEGHADEAIAWFEKAVAANDQVSVHHLWLGNALGIQAPHVSRFKQPFLARRIKSEFDKAVQLDPTSIDARHGLIQFYSMAPGVMGGSIDKAKEQAAEIGKLDPWRGHAELSRLLERDKDLAGAESELTAAVAAAPDSGAAYSALASFYRRQKRWSAAVGTYENLLKRRPDAINARLNIAATLNQSGADAERAEREAAAWLGNPPADAPRSSFSVAHFLLGQCAEKQGNRGSAKAEYQQALTFNPGNADAKKAIDAMR